MKQNHIFADDVRVDYFSLLHCSWIWRTEPYCYSLVVWAKSVAQNLTFYGALFDVHGFLKYERRHQSVTFNSLATQWVNNHIYKSFSFGSKQNSKVYSSEKWGEKLVLSRGTPGRGTQLFSPMGMSGVKRRKVWSNHWASILAWWSKELNILGAYELKFGPFRYSL